MSKDRGRIRAVPDYDLTLALREEEPLSSADIDRLVDAFPYAAARTDRQGLSVRCTVDAESAEDAQREGFRLWQAQDFPGAVLLAVEVEAA